MLEGCHAFVWLIHGEEKSSLGGINPSSEMAEVVVYGSSFQGHCHVSHQCRVVPDPAGCCFGLLDLLVPDHLGTAVAVVEVVRDTDHAHGGDVVS